MKIHYLKSLLLFSSFATTAYAATYTVNANTDTGTGAGTTGDLRYCLNLINSTPDANATINITFASPTTITLVNNLPAIVVPNSTTVITNAGAGATTIDGSSHQFQPFVAYNGGTSTVSLSGGSAGLTIQNTKAQGGSGGNGQGGGGGGGLGAGGGLFVKAGNTVSLTSVAFNSNQAQGGSGGVGNAGGAGGGGGGGLFGTGGNANTSAGGGGGGFYGTGGAGQAGGGGGGGFFFNGGAGDSQGDGGGGGGFLSAGAAGAVNAGGPGGNGGGSGGGGKGGNAPGGFGNPGGAAGSGGSVGATGTPAGLDTGGTGGAGGAAGFFGGGGGGGAGGTGTIGGNSSGGGNGFPSGGSGNSDGGGGGGGANHVGLGSTDTSAGGRGGFGGGGGGNGNNTAIGATPDGGFGGGGGGGTFAGTIAAGTGGFGAGGGGGSTAGSGGTYGGGGGSSLRGGGGGGGGLGGAIFLENDALATTGAILTINDGCSFISNNTFSGTGGAGSTAGSNGSNGGNDIFMMSGTTLNFNITGSLTIPNPIESDNGTAVANTGLKMINSGTLTLVGTPVLSAAPGYTGGTYFDAGTISVAADASLGRDGLIFNGGTLQWTADTSSNRSISVLLGGGKLDTQGNTVTLSGPISGSGTLQKNGVGTINLPNANSGYSGLTLLNDGLINIGDDNSLGSNTFTFAMNSNNTLQAGASVNISNNIIINADGNFDSNGNTFTVSGQLSGSSSFTKIGAGTLSLPNANSFYTKPSYLSNGTISIGNATSLGSNSLTFQTNSGNTLQAAGSISINNALIFNQPGFIDTQGNTFTLSKPTGAISGSSSMTKIGTGILSLPNTNAGYTQPIFLSNGTINIGNAASLGGGSLTFQTNNGNTLQAGGTFAINNDLVLNAAANIDSNGNVLTIDGDITGTSSLTKVGTGTVALSNLSNNYSGGTFINAGTFEVTGVIGGAVTVNAGTFDVENTFTITDFTGAAGSSTNLGGIGEVLTFGTANSTSVDGTIVGPGGLTKQGSGTVTFSGANTYIGPTLINAGTLVINGSSNSPTTVAAGATLKGTGTINAPVTVNGTLRPGNSVGTINVLGPVTFNSGSTYAEELNPSQASLLNVTGGNVTINPNVTLAIIPNPGTYAPGSTYTIIQTAGGFGVAGTFSNVTDTLPLLQFTVSYTPNTVVLNLTKKAGGFSNLVTSGNAGAVAVCLDHANPTPGSDFANVLNQLLSVTTEETLEHDLNQLQPSQYNALELSQENVNTRLLSVLSLRAAQLHRACKPQSETWGVWADAFGDALEQKHQQKQYGFHANSGAVLAGADGHAMDRLHLGVGGAYTWTSLEWAGDHGDGDISSGYGFAYGTWNARHFFLDAFFVGGYNNYEAKRHIDFLTIDRHAKSEHHGYTLAGRLTGGVPFKVWKGEVAPIISLDYDYVHQSAFKEHGAKSLNLHIHEKNANLLRAEAGFRVSRRCPPELKMDPCTKKQTCVSDARWLPSFQLTVIREWRFQGDRLRSRLQDLNCVFSSKGLNPDRTLIAPAVSMTYLVGDRIGLTLDYAGEFDVNGKYWDQKGNFQVSYAF